MRQLFLFLMILIFSDCLLQAEIKIPNFFSDGMVLQRQKPVPVWGWGTPGENVTVSFKGHSLSAVVSASGEWKVIFPSMKADKIPANIEIISKSGKKVISNVVIGEVWICSGQSNMEFTIRGLKNASEIAKTANYPLLRTYNIYQVLSGYPEKNVNGKWVECSSATVASFSAVGFYFGRELMEKLDVPVGIINSSVGCTSIEAWTSGEGFRMIPELKAHVEKIENANREYEKEWREYLPKVQAWLANGGKTQNNPFPVKVYTKNKSIL